VERDMMDTICVIDDDAMLLEAIETYLELEGFAVETFPSAAEFLKTDRLDDAQCIVTDVEMPGELSGIDLVSEVARRGSGCPVIVMTGRASAKLRDDAFEKGAADFLPKPVMPEELVDAVRLALRHKATAI
jgi:FixJ family two-component response regulator